MRFIAGIEAGGTSVKVAIAVHDEPTTMLRRTRIPTTTPTETLGAVTAWLDEQLGEEIKSFEAIGVASFGPVDLQRGSKTYGFITSTPKPGWQQVDMLSPLLKYECSLGFDTDVNGAATGEMAWGLHDGARSVAYITVGTGVGVGVVVEGKAIHGLLHPEGGHIPIPRHEDEPLKRGVCPFHPSCVEGFVCTGALAARVDRPASDLALVGDEDVVWDLAAFYLAQLCASIALLCSPEVIVLGGGVIVNRPVIMDKIRKIAPEILNGYMQSPKLKPEAMASYVVFSRHGDDAGLVGAMELARETLK